MATKKNKKTEAKEEAIDVVAEQPTFANDVSLVTDESEIDKFRTHEFKTKLVPGAVLIMLEPDGGNGFYFTKESLMDPNSFNETTVQIENISRVLMYILANKPEILQAVAAEMVNSWQNNCQGNA